jgi:anti-repressor protein
MKHKSLEEIMEMIIAPGPLLMTSREIADLASRRHDNVMRVCRELKASGVTPQIEESKFSHNGNVYSEFLIGKRDSLVLVARLSPEFTGRIVDRWLELEAVIAAPAIKTPGSFSAALRLAAEQQEIIEEQAAKIASDAPKVLFAETIRAIDGVCHIEKVGKMIGIGRTKLFKRLREDHILIDGSRMPYQKYIDKGYFTVNEGNPYKDSKDVWHPTFTTMVTGAGQVFLIRKYSKPDEVKS